jgi:hypothetical protein
MISTYTLNGIVSISFFQNQSSLIYLLPLHPPFISTYSPLSFLLPFPCPKGRGGGKSIVLTIYYLTGKLDTILCCVVGSPLGEQGEVGRLLKLPALSSYSVGIKY